MDGWMDGWMDEGEVRTVSSLVGLSLVGLSHFFKLSTPLSTSTTLCLFLSDRTFVYRGDHALCRLSLTSVCLSL